MKRVTKKKVLKHLKSDIKSFKKEAYEDKKLMKSIRDAHKDEKSKKDKKKVHHKKKEDPAQKKVHKVMKEFKEDKLHSGSKKGPKVKNRKQAIAIALSEARRGKKK